MRIKQLDPNYLTSDRSKANFRLALMFGLVFVGLLWVVQIVNFISAYSLNQFGLIPRDITGLRGILLAPLLHANFTHLFNNSLPLALVGTLGLFVYPNSLLRALPVIYFGSGLMVWVLGRQSIHIGASGLVYGLTAFVFVSGLAKRDARGIAVSMLVWFLYSGLSWGILPQGGHVSWESHLFGAVLGVGMALGYRRWDRPPEKKYSWDEEE